MDLEKQLAASSKAFLKPWLLVRPLNLFAKAALLAIGVAAAALAYANRDWWKTGQPVLQLPLWRVAAVVLLILGLIRAKGLTGVLALAWPLATIHLRFLDPLFLRRGRFIRLLSLSERTRGRSASRLPP